MHEADAARDDVDAVMNGLLKYNNAYTEFNRRELNIFARDAGGQIIGGLLGESMFGWLHIRVFWLAEDKRRKGLGTRLLEMAEDEGRLRGCKAVYLNTFSFQARPFYEKLGYECFATQDDFPVGHESYSMKKTL
jgi:GNAT superfamily N-acetyltransferase